MDIKKVTVIGGGVLGSQIAYQSAYKGFDVTTWVRSEGSIERARPKMERLHGIYVAELTAARDRGARLSRGLSSESVPDYDALIAAADRACESFRYCTDLAEAVSDADLVIEALSENLDEKEEFYTKLRSLLPEKTIIATNSSTLLPSMMAGFTGRPEKFLALHFANNIWMQNTAEIMGHSGTDAAAYEQVAEFAEAIGMVPLRIKKEKAGYILNSMLVPFLSSSLALLVDGIADAETIDKTWVLATGAPMGPFRILDVVGLTTAFNIVAANPAAKDPNSAHARIAKMLKEEYIDKGKTGVNAGEGFYKYG